MDRPTATARKPHDPFPDRGMSYRAWYIRERAAGRATRPGPQAINAGITPRGYNHTPPRPRSFVWQRIYYAGGPRR